MVLTVTELTATALCRESEILSTVVGRAEPHNLRLVHPCQDRTVSIRENARAQASLPAARDFSCHSPAVTLPSTARAAAASAAFDAAQYFISWLQRLQTLLQCEICTGIPVRKRQ